MPNSAIRRVASLLCLSVLTLGSGAALAQAAYDEAELSVLSLEELLDLKVVSASRLPEDPWTAPAVIHVFTEDMIRQRGYTSLVDLLQDVPGVQIQRRSQVDAFNVASIRGIGSAPGNEKFLIMLNGFRITPSTGDWYALAKQFSLLGARQVEVVLGASSALHGADAFAGIINIITHKGDERAGSHVEASYGQYGTVEAAFHAGAALEKVPFLEGLKLERAAVALSGHYYRSDEPFLPEAYPEDFAWYRDRYQTGGEVRASPFAPPDVVVNVGAQPYATPTDSLFLQARVNLGDFELGYVRLSEAHSSSTGVRPEFSLYTRNAVLASNSQLLYGAHLFNGAGWSLASNLSIQSNTLDPTSRFVNSFSSYQEAYKYGTSLVTTVDEQLTLSGIADLPIVAGVSFSNLTAQARSADLPAPYDPNASAAEQDIFYPGTEVTDASGRSLAIAQDFYSVDYRNLGTYLQVQLKKFSFVEASLGARYDVNSRYGNSFNPRAALVFKPTNEVRVKVLYGEAFLAPSPNKTYQHFGSFFPTTDSGGNVTGLAGGFWFLPNPDLAPEKLRSGEVMAMWKPTENLRISAGGYYGQITDLIRPGPVELGVTFKGVPLQAAQRFVNEGTVVIYGGTAQAEASWDLGPLGVRAQAAYAYTAGEIDDGPLSLNALHNVQTLVDLAYDTGPHTLSLSPRLLFRSSTLVRATDSGGNPTTINADPFAVVNLFARYTYQAGKTFKPSVFLRVDNLLNARYYHATEFSPDTFTLVPQDPIRAVLGVSVDI